MLDQKGCLVIFWGLKACIFGITTAGIQSW